MRPVGLLGIVAVIASPSVAQDRPAPHALQAGLAGKWTGALGYRDYRSNKLFELAVTTDIRVYPDNATIIRVSSFDDGPKTGFVYITSASLYDAAKGTVTATTLRKGRPVETSTETVSIVSYVDATHWVVRYQSDGTDDDKPAQLRMTETRDGDQLLSVKEVMPQAEPSKGWQFRNQTRLTRVPG